MNFCCDTSRNDELMGLLSNAHLLVRKANGGRSLSPASHGVIRLPLPSDLLLNRCRFGAPSLSQPFVVVARAPRLRVGPIGDVQNKAEVGRNVEDPEAREVAMIAPGPLERLTFALLASIRAERYSPLANSWPWTMRPSVGS